MAEVGGERRKLLLDVHTFAMPIEQRLDGEAVPEVVDARPGTIAGAPQPAFFGAMTAVAVWVGTGNGSGIGHPGPGVPSSRSGPAIASVANAGSTRSFTVRQSAGPRPRLALNPWLVVR